MNDYDAHDPYYEPVPLTMAASLARNIRRGTASPEAASGINLIIEAQQRIGLTASKPPCTNGCGKPAGRGLGGLCPGCYNKAGPKAPCRCGCGRFAGRRRGLADYCYDKHSRAGTLELYPKSRTRRATLPAADEDGE